MEKMPSATVLRRLLELRSDGTLVWKERGIEDCPSEADRKRFNKQHAGRPALTALAPNGYRVGLLFQKNCFAHKVVFKMVHGYEPDQVDHINGIKADNRPENLRAATHTQNMRNAKLRRDNKSGVVGVRWCSKKNGWVATIGLGEGKGKKWLGLFKNKEAAVEARRRAEQELGYPTGHGKR